MANWRAHLFTGKGRPFDRVRTRSNPGQVPLRRTFWVSSYGGAGKAAKRGKNKEFRPLAGRGWYRREPGEATGSVGRKCVSY